ncbi:MAG TPA: TonB-dependent receptor [Gammaproteobacteria bacterium]
MAKQRKRSRKALTIASSGLAALAAGECALGQDSAPASIEEVTVTGSRIQRDVGFASPVPVTAVAQEELTMFEPGLGVAQQLESLPQYFGNVSSDDIAGRVSADVGQSQLNMRGMGGERTLVLLDGLRIVPSDRRSSVSVDYLPSSLIRRVEVVTGGASAAYGADAVAGVTNFILDRDFTGLDFSVRTGMNEFGDGEYTRGSVTWGDDLGANDRLHLFGTVEARVNDGYRRGERGDAYAVDWDKEQGYVLNPEWFPGAPPGIPQRLTMDYVYDTDFSPTGLIRQPGFSLDRYQFTEDGTGVIPFEEADFVSLPGQPGTQQSQAGQPGDYQYDLWKRTHPQTFERVGVEQQTVFLGTDFLLNDTTTLWGHALYGRTKNTVEPTTSGGSGTFLGHAGLAFITAFRENPFLPEEVREAMEAEGLNSIRVDQHGYLDSDWGYQEQPVITNELWSWTIGFDKELVGDWNLRGAFQYGEAKKRNKNKNWERLDRFYLATDAVEDPENPGEIVCRIQLVARELERQGRNLEEELHQWALENTSVFHTDSLELDPSIPSPIDYPIAVDSIDGTISDCVPVNMFGNGNQSQEAMDYIFPDRHKVGVSRQKQHFAELLATGTLAEGWAGAIEGAFGATYRKESIHQYIEDTAIDLLGPIYNVTLDDGTVAIRGIAPFLHGSATNLHRFSDQPTFKGGFDVWEVFTEEVVPLFSTDNGRYGELSVAARFTDYSRAGEKVVWKGGLSLQLTEAFRFRGTYSHDIREGSFEELFVQQGRGTDVTDPWNNNESYTTFNLTGGNPDLEPEEADTTVVGFVYQPTRVPGLQLSADRYVVDLSSAIGTFEEQEIVDQCFETGALCDRVERSPTTGRINRVKTLFVNIDAAKVSGYDFEASYRIEPDFLNNRSEALMLRAFAGYMDENSSTPLGGTKIDQAGSANLPKRTLTATVSYNAGNFGINLQQNWRSRTKRNISWVEGVDVDDNSVPSVSLTNLGVFWTGDTAGGNTWRASLNVNNLFDRDPVIAGTTLVGDVLGRRYSLGFEYSMQ